ncbi:Bromodomain adjacent to zinc finger domain protein 2A [Heterocephalus glaber]|uniref:Bromodomain adjacent to zinc finger domain protein 2A n=1 Tax=Heterocephalus glaber TaxID=10181 RepID=G5B1W4_HETGA|nr:Bromodomain adjacent to zinc finger domain protein 2A [Heterocephalus glaber]
MLGSSIQTSAPSQEVGSVIHPDEAAEKELTSVMAENGTGLVGSLELEEEQPVCCLDDPSHLPGQLEDTPILNEDSLEPFDSLAPEPVSGGLYGIDDTELMGAEDKLPLEDSPVISALDCPSLNNATPFSLLADDSQTSASIFSSPSSLPDLGESVLQDNSFDLNNGSDVEQEEMETQGSDFPPPLAQPHPDQSSTIQIQQHPVASPAVSPTVSPEISAPEVSLSVSPAASPRLCPAACPVVSPVSSAVSSEVALTAPVSSPKSSSVTSPASAFPANKDVSSFHEATGDLEEITGDATTSGNGDVLRRRIATPEEVRLPLQHGWRREVCIRKGSHQWQGETWYYGPSGKRMKQFPEVIKYLSRNVVHSVRREHFSFSPRMPVGDFFEERDTPEGLQWVQLSAEESPSRIQAITGKQGQPRNNEKAKTKEVPKVKRGRAWPPKVKFPELLNKTDNHLPKKLEAQETLNEEDKAKMSKSKKKMRQKIQRGECQTPIQGQAKNKRKLETKSLKQKDPKKKLKAKKEKVKTKQEKLKEKNEKGKGRENLAVMQLAALEQNVEWRYLREPLRSAHEVVLEKALLSTPSGAPEGTTTEISYEITPCVRVWHQTLGRCRSAAQHVEEEFTQKPGFPKRGQKRKSAYSLNFPEADGRRRQVLSRGPRKPVISTSVLRGRAASLCEIILMQMESHDAAWPFLEPVNPQLVSGYRRIIKNPMDFSTMRERLLRGGYTSSEEFAADALLVFDNCQPFNEDDSDVGKAGHIMRQFFESRWEEFYQGKQANL